MKKYLIILFVFSFNCLQAQNTNNDDVYTQTQLKTNWVKKAAKLKEQITLDKNNAITYKCIIQADGKSKEQLYKSLYTYFGREIVNSNVAIKTADCDLGIINAKIYLKDIVVYTTFSGYNHISVEPFIKCDIKDNKVRIIYTMQHYISRRESSSFSAGLTESWTISSCFPFVKKDSHKKTSSKAFVMADSYAKSILKELNDCIKDGAFEDDYKEW